MVRSAAGSNTSSGASDLKVNAFVLTVLVTFLACSLAFAQASGLPARQSLILSDEQVEYPLGRRMQILEDPAGTLTIEQVSSPAYDTQFVTSQVEAPNYGLTKSVYWVRVRLDNQTHRTVEWPLEVNYANMQYVDLYTPLPGGGGFEVIQTGVSRPVETRDVLYPNIVFNLDIPVQSQPTYYLRFQNDGSMTLPLTLWTKEAFLVHSQHNLMLHWLFFGAVLALLVYHLFLLFTLKEASYLYFVLLLDSLLVIGLTYTGYLGVYFFPSLYIVQPLFLPLSFSFLLVSMILFSDKFLELKSRAPKYHWVNIWFVAAWGVLMLLTPFISYHIIAWVMLVWALISLVAIWGPWFAIVNKGFLPARFFMLAWLAMVASLFLVILVRLGMVPSTKLTENLYQPGVLLMAVGWSIALADRINLYKAQTENANLQLKNSERRLSDILDDMPVAVVLYGKDHKPKYANRRTHDLLTNLAQGIRPDVFAGRTLAQAMRYFSLKIAGSREDYPIENLPVYNALKGTPASADDIEIDRGDQHIPLEMWASPVKDDAGKIESAVVVFQDITQRKRAEAEITEYRKHLEALVEKRTADLYGATQKLTVRLDWMYMINKLHPAIKGMASLSPVYEELSGKILQLLDASIVFIVCWEQQSDKPEILYCSTKVGSNIETTTLQAPFQKDSLLRRDINRGKVVTLAPEQGVAMTDALAHCFTDHGFQLILLAPIVIRKSVIGALGIGAGSSSRESILQQQDLVERMAYDLASLIQEALLYDQALVLAMTEERNRLARDLHDSVTQALFSATLLADVLPQIWKRDPNLGLLELNKLKRLTHGSLAEMRTMLLELRPVAVTRTPLGELLSQLAQAVASRGGLDVQLFVEQIPILPEEVQLNFYRIAQEALNNVVKHAQAQEVMVSLSNSLVPEDAAGSRVHEVTLKICDDGVGFVAEMRQSEQLGIGFMTERANAIQAILSLESQPGHGTQLILTWCGEVGSTAE